MSVYLVTWDLNKEGSNYSFARTKLINKIGEYDNIKDSDLDSVYLISTHSSLSILYNDLLKEIDKNDSLFVTKLVKGDYSGWLSKEVWNWIDSHI